MSVSDARDLMEQVSPWAWFLISAVSAVVFWLIFPFAFVVGTAWAGIKGGFIFGRDW